MHASACELVDDVGHRVILSHPAQRIISLEPDVTEILFAVGAGSKIIGVMQGSDWPRAAKKIPVVAAFDHIDAEHIVLLKPDLVIAPDDHDLMMQLMKINAPIFFVHSRYLSDIPKHLRQFGCLTGLTKKAEAEARKFEKHYRALVQRYKSTKKTKVFYIVWSKPLFTITQSNWINEVIELCGGQNIYAELPGASPSVSFESVLEKAPDVIISTQSNPQWQQAWQAWPVIPAVKNHRLFTVNQDRLERAGPRVLDAADQVCEILAGVRINQH
ncbi:MAG: cobalamin-binding protein [Gammaproteobacteria bacterium]|nr:cobalamin-binding protein [Gammaproteobacteria bacterium]